MSNQSRGLAAQYAHGRALIRKQNENARRLDGINALLAAAVHDQIHLTETELDFVLSLNRETNPEAPDIFCGDAVICDSLCRKYSIPFAGPCRLTILPGPSKGSGLA